MYSLQVVGVSMDMFIRSIDLTSISTILDIGFWICSGGAVILFFHFIPDKGTCFYHIFFTVHAHLSYGGCEQSGQIRTCNRNNMCLCFKVSYAMVNEIWNGKTDTWNLNFQSDYIFCMMFFFTEAFTRLPQCNLPSPCNLSKHSGGGQIFFIWKFKNVFGLREEFSPK